MAAEGPALHPSATAAVEGGIVSIPRGVLAAGIGCAALGATTIAGWTLHATRLVQYAPGMVPMMYNTALGFVLLGVGLVFLHARRRGAASACGALALLIGGATIGEYATGIDFRIDRLFFEPTLAEGASHAGRMSPNAALCFALAGAGLLLASRRALSIARGHLLTLLGAAAVVLGIDALYGYAAEIEPAYGWGTFTQMAPQTAIGLILAGAGLLCVECGLRGSPGRVAILLGAGKALIVLCLAQTLAASMPGSPLAAVVFSVGLALSGLLVLTTWLAMTSRQQARLAVSLNRRLELEIADREKAEETLRASEERFRLVSENAVDAVVVANDRGNITYFNEAAERLFGRTSAQACGQLLTILMPARFTDAHERGLARFLKTGESRVLGRTLELAGRRADGTEFPLEISIAKGDSAHGVFFVGILRDISQRKRVDQMKNEFISTVSHEIRTPMTSIHGSLGLLASGRMGDIPSAAAGLVGIAQKNSERLIRLINDILDIEKIESGSMPFHVREVEVVSAVRDAVEAARSYAQQLGVSIEVSTPPRLRVLADGDRLAQVLTNLLSNAVKFSPSGGTVSVVGERRAGRVRVSVIDRGPGIPASFRPRLFEKFAQADASMSRVKGGTGLGLSIVKAIVERLGGEVSFETEEAKGTTFHVDLPVAKPIVEEPHPDGALDRILVCEDDPDVAHLVRLILSEAGLACDVCHDATEAKEALKKHRYSALTLDLILPDQDGVALIRELREAPDTHDLPIVVISVKADAARSELNGGAFGVVDWLSKPIQEERLLKAVRRALGVVEDRLPRILHVEDDRDLSRVVSLLLWDVARVHRAGGLEEARAMLAKEVFDLVLLDVVLPDGSGVEVLPLLGDAPVVIFSAREVDGDLAGHVTAALVKSRTTNDRLREVVMRALPRKGGAGPAKEAGVGWTTEGR